MHVDLEKKFPGAAHDVAAIAQRYSGLTKREFFAAMAMQGMMSLDPSEMANCTGSEFKTVGEWMARNCLDAADALIAELNK